jgi:hypothetical protein
VNENNTLQLPPGLPPTIGWLVEFDEMTAGGWEPQRHLLLEEPEGHYADCATPLVSALAAHDLGYMGWIPLSEKLPGVMSGYVALLHPDSDEPTISYVGTHPIDFREDGYSHYMPLARIPQEHLRHRRKAKSTKK